MLKKSTQMTLRYKNGMHWGRKMERSRRIWRCSCGRMIEQCLRDSCSTTATMLPWSLPRSLGAEPSKQAPHLSGVRGPIVESSPRHLAAGASFIAPFAFRLASHSAAALVATQPRPLVILCMYMIRASAVW